MIPIVYMEENRVFDIYGNPYAVYIIDSAPYAFQPKRVKRQVINRVVSGVSKIVDEFHIYLLAKQWSIQQLTKEMRKFGNHPIWNRHVELTKELLGRRLPFTRQNLLVIPLNRKRILLKLEGDNWREWMHEAYRSVINGVKDVKDRLHRGPLDLPIEILDDIKQQSQDYLTTLRALGSVREAKLHEVEWWLKKSNFRGLLDPVGQIPEPFPAMAVTKNGRNLLRPIRTSLLSLSDVRMRERLNRLEIEHDENQVSYQSFYASINVPQPIPENDPTGREWLYGVLEALQFPVDASLHIRVESHKEALDNLQKKKRTAEEQKKEWTENDQDVPLEIDEDLEIVDVLEKKLRSRQPLLHVKTVFALGASSKEQLKIRSTDFISQAEKFHTLVKSPGDMKRMYQAFFPFGEELPDTWETPMDPGILGAAVPFGTRALGDPNGFMLGRLATGRVVFMNPKRPAQELNTASSMLFCGKLGSGKTYTMKIIIAILLSWNAVGYAIDPKGDYGEFTNIPDFSDDIKMVSFTHGSETRFTPFRLGSSRSDSYDAAFGILELIFNPNSEEIRNIVIGTALEQVYKGQKWDMFAFIHEIDEIKDHSPEENYRYEAKIISHRLQLLIQNGLGSLLFGHDTGESMMDKKMFLAIVRGLTLPSRGTPKNQWAEGERLSAAMLYAVATLGLKQLMSLPKSVLKFLLLEEIWVLREFDQGRKLYNEALRLSRSENLIVLMAGQNATDFEAREDEEDISGLFGWKFMYKLDSLAQVEAALRILGMTDEDPESWYKTFSEDYHNGFGLVKDPEGRIGELQVDLIDKSLHQYFSSTPGGEEVSV